MKEFNIDDLTLGQLKQIQALAAISGSLPSAPTTHPAVGKHFIIRTYSAGVHAGILVAQDGDLVVLKDSRRLWSWTAKEGVALSGVAVHGLKGVCKVDVVLPELYLTGAIETIPTTEAARKSIENA